MKILLVEDGLYKSERVEDFLKSVYENIEVTVAISYSSGVKSLIYNSFDVAILDMSLPTFDEVKGQGGGDKRMYGGLDIARQIKRRNIKCPFIFLTQHQSFSENSKISKLSDIDSQAREDYGNLYLGSVYYEHSGFKWKESLKELLDDLS